MNHGNISKQIAEGLIELKSRINAAAIPSSKIDETLNIATWNIREFGKKPRKEAAIHYIAEIIGQFDLVALVELRDDLNDLGRVLQVLGPYWRTVYSDAITDAGGNRERIAYVYDKRAVVFNGLAAEASPPRQKNGTEYLSKLSWWRSPYTASFRAGSFDFVAFTTHVRWGDSLPAREKELGSLAAWIDAKQKEEHNEDKDILVMGDFNIPSRDDSLFKAMTQHGLQIPAALLNLKVGTNLAKNKRYDQILHYPRYDQSFTNSGGVLDFYQGNVNRLFPGMSKNEFTYQLSDHLPLWMQINTDLEGLKLEQIVRG